ncbi:GreA/GreB family elongation factor [Azospirillum sp.]|uniref:GreA/GreB family elongation factor n=1 Tax=Azospirillum sp. TaxID=34012 RepID=UPI002D58AF4B|nr:GreA/GreB family elongation factor [Azospirillum sp.]HYD70078.1 GreA/GreB family elongation factor [Azospirillum sp.]
MNDRDELPPIWIGLADYARLLRAMEHLAAQAPEVSAFLCKELDRAIVRPDGELPRAVVRMGARVLFRRAEDMDAEWGELSYPEQPPAGGRVSIASPVGAALLGLRQGSGMTYVDGGARRQLTVERVLPP